ncbi:hypothetical protein PI125_g24888 [Phytophthora idaei]|nr:hypothetical protein PI125_g24888 [Phytophthora idaei]KAG3125217.1 hypothetical protein PI126_g22874 [Phytophthora idaei]
MMAKMLLSVDADADQVTKVSLVVLARTVMPAGRGADCSSNAPPGRFATSTTFRRTAAPLDCSVNEQSNCFANAPPNCFTTAHTDGSITSDNCFATAATFRLTSAKPDGSTFRHTAALPDDPSFHRASADDSKRR